MARGASELVRDFAAAAAVAVASPTCATDAPGSSSAVVEPGSPEHALKQVQVRLRL